MVLRVGITGGIGAGKTLVAEIFRTFGIPVYEADLRAKIIMSEDAELKEAIRVAFGSEAYLDGMLNRSFIAGKIFENEKNLARINELVHPAVIKDYHRWLQDHDDHPYTIKEAALLFESGSYKALDKIILVYAPQNLRIKRVLMRDVHRSQKDIENIMARQLSDAEKKKRSDYIIINDEQKMVVPQVLEIHRELTNTVQNRQNTGTE